MFLSRLVPEVISAVCLSTCASLRLWRSAVLVRRRLQPRKLQRIQTATRFVSDSPRLFHALTERALVCERELAQCVCMCSRTRVKSTDMTACVCVCEGMRWKRGRLLRACPVTVAHDTVLRSRERLCVYQVAGCGLFVSRSLCQHNLISLSASCSCLFTHTQRPHERRTNDRACRSGTRAKDQMTCQLISKPVSWAPPSRSQSRMVACVWASGRAFGCANTATALVHANSSSRSTVLLDPLTPRPTPPPQPTPITDESSGTLTARESGVASALAQSINQTTTATKEQELVKQTRMRQREASKQTDP